MITALVSQVRSFAKQLRQATFRVQKKVRFIALVPHS